MENMLFRLGSQIQNSMSSIAINLLFEIEDHTFGLHRLLDSGYPRLSYLQYVNIGMILGRRESRLVSIYSTVTTNKFNLFIKACRASLFWLILGKNEKLTSNAKERKQQRT